MKKFICKSLLFCVLMLALMSCISAYILFGLPAQFNPTYQHALSLQYDSLKRLSSPKVVVMGDSSVPFSLDTKLMKKQLGAPVQTLGIHSGTGLEYILSLSKCNIKKGDIMVLDLAPSNEDSFSPSVVLTACENNFSMYQYFSQNDWQKVISYYPSFLLKKIKYRFNIRDAQTPAYSGSSFDRDGNYNFYRGNCTLPVRLSKSDDVTSFHASDYNPQFIAFLNNYDRYCKENGATFLISFPPYLKDSVTSSRQDMNDLQRYLTSKLSAPIITRISDRALSRSYIYNNVSHCNSQGADIVTNELTHEIENYLRKQRSVGSFALPQPKEPVSLTVGANVISKSKARHSVKLVVLTYRHPKKSGFLPKTHGTFQEGKKAKKAALAM